MPWRHFAHRALPRSGGAGRVLIGEGDTALLCARVMARLATSGSQRVLGERHPLGGSAARMAFSAIIYGDAARMIVNRAPLPLLLVIQISHSFINAVRPPPS
jgi:hypothetical protein